MSLPHRKHIDISCFVHKQLIYHQPTVAKLIVAMKSAGYGEDLINKICYKNWHNLIHMTIN